MSDRFDFVFINQTEVRMGSPYKTCTIQFIGSKQPYIGTTDYQEIYAWTTDRDYLALVRWNIRNNKPGYNIYLVESESGRVSVSDRFEGFCKDVEFDGNNIVLTSSFQQVTTSRYLSLTELIQSSSS